MKLNNVYTLNCLQFVLSIVWLLFNKWKRFRNSNSLSNSIQLEIDLPSSAPFVFYMLIDYKQSLFNFAVTLAAIIHKFTKRSRLTSNSTWACK